MKLTRKQWIIVIVVAASIAAIWWYMRTKPVTTSSMGDTPPQESPESDFSSIPGTTPFNQTFMQPASYREAVLTVENAINV